MIQLKKMVDHLLYRRLAAELYKDGDKVIPSVSQGFFFHVVVVSLAPSVWSHKFSGAISSTSIPGRVFKSKSPEIIVVYIHQGISSSFLMSAVDGDSLVVNAVLQSSTCC